MKENFYHGILLGLFAGMNNWRVKSNAEAGEGYSDISIEIDDKEIGPGTKPLNLLGFCQRK